MVYDNDTPKEKEESPAVKETAKELIVKMLSFNRKPLSLMELRNSSFTDHTMSRRLAELVEDGIIFVKKRDGEKFSEWWVEIKGQKELGI